MDLKKNPELFPLIEWWEKDGKSTVIYLLVAAIAVAGWYGWKHHKAAVKNAASEALVGAYTVEELEEAVSKFGDTTTGGALKIRLAKGYFDAERYEDALAQYDALIGHAPDGFADIPVVGRAQCLEALGKFEEAAKEFDVFAEMSPKNYLTLTAQLGAARCFVQAGDSKKALARIEAIRKANKDDELALARIEATENAIKRYGQKAAPKPVEVKPAEASKAEVKPAEVKPAEAPKAEVKPAETPKAEVKPAAKPAEAPKAAPKPVAAKPATTNAPAAKK